MLANPYDPSRDLSPNLPTTSCRGQELTSVFGVVGGGGVGNGTGTGTGNGNGGGQCCAFKSEFDDDCPDCCKVSPPTVAGLAGDDYRGGPLALPCKQERDGGGDPMAGLVGLSSSPAGHHLNSGHHQQQQLHHNQHHNQQQQQHNGQNQHAVGYGSPPEPSPSPGLMSYGGGAYGSPPDLMVRPKQEEPEVNLCDGCGLKILDRYYLFAVDKRWHATCLQCSQCSRTLATEIKCFYRDGNIYCKTDYQRYGIYLLHIYVYIYIILRFIVVRT